MFLSTHFLYKNMSSKKSDVSSNWGNSQQTR